MGRWAEVYFTSPPEQRDAAVLDLLHELQPANPQAPGRNANPRGSGTTRTAPWPGSSGSMGVAAPKLSPASTMTEEPAVRCSSCGHENPPLHRFCGDCGAPLASAPENEKSSGMDVRSVEAQFETNRSEASQEESTSHDTARETSVEEIRARLDSHHREFEESIAHPQELSLFRSFREDSGDDDWNEGPPRRRFYLFAVLAILVAGAIYMAWRSGQLSAQRGREAQSAASATHEDSPAASDHTSNGSAPAATPGQAAAPALKQYEKTPAANRPVPSSDARDKSIQRVSSSRIVEEPLAPQTPLDNGGEELALAQRYLNGASGQSRDSAEAAKWLWKSISKHNGEASVLLADLYLKGDGVSKNCDQARVLLDTAGRKGVPGAGMRLRNLQAFGCQ